MFMEGRECNELLLMNVHGGKGVYDPTMEPEEEGEDSNCSGSDAT
jgi:hypothetical protein